MGSIDQSHDFVDLVQRRTRAHADTLEQLGNNTVLTPTAGGFLLLQYVCLSADGENLADVVASILLGTDLKYRVSLKPGSIWARNIGAGRRIVTGAVDEPLILNLSAAQKVHISVETEEY